jgi:hypothetical protein
MLLEKVFLINICKIPCFRDIQNQFRHNDLKKLKEG